MAASAQRILLGVLIDILSLILGKLVILVDGNYKNSYSTNQKWDFAKKSHPVNCFYRNISCCRCRFTHKPYLGKCLLSDQGDHIMSSNFL